MQEWLIPTSMHINWLVNPMRQFTLKGKEDHWNDTHFTHKERRKLFLVDHFLDLSILIKFLLEISFCFTFRPNGIERQYRQKCKKWVILFSRNDSSTCSRNRCKRFSPLLGLGKTITVGYSWWNYFFMLNIE